MSYIKYFELIADLVSGKISREEFERQTVDQGLFLENLICSFLQKNIECGDFEELFTKFLFDLTGGFLDAEANDFFSKVNEKLAWTSEFPTKYERSVGWIDQDEFFVWLSEEFHKYKE